MKITEAKVYPLKKNNDKIKAFASITLDEEFVVKGLKVVKGEKGLFVAMPSTKGKDDKYYEDCFPLTAELREKINKKVIDAYEDL